MAIVYSTCDVHPRDSFSYWLEVVTHEFVRLGLSPSQRRGFQASLRISTLGPLSISSYECDPHDVARTPRDISRADSDDMFICLQRSGRSINVQADREIIVDRGSFFLLDPQRPFTGRSEQNGKMIAIGVPRSKLHARLGSASVLGSRALGGGRSLTGLVYGFLTMLPDYTDELDDAASTKLAEQALDLIALAFSAETEGSVALSSPRAAALTLLKAAIETRLHEPALRPATAAAAAGISVRYANTLLAHEETCLERYIFDRRLDRCRRALEDATQQHRTITEIAYGWGFSDPSHFARRFKTAFACSPGEYRKARRRLRDC